MIVGIISAFAPESKTKISVDLDVTSVELKLADDIAENKHFIKLDIQASSGEALFTAPEGAVLRSNLLGFEQARDLPIYLKPGPVNKKFILEVIQVPNRTALTMQVTPDSEFYINMNSGKGQIYNWAVNAVPNISISQNHELFKTYRFANGDDEGDLKFSDTVKNENDEIKLDFFKFKPWKLQSRVFIKDVQFLDAGNLRDDSLSSIISGKVKLLETNDPIHILSERDILKLALTQNSEIFLSGDNQIIHVHFEAIVSKLMFGPQLLAHKNQMPPNIKTLGDLAPLFLSILTLIVPFLHTIIARKK